MEDKEKRFKQYLKVTGYKYTTERKTIMQAILSINDHFDVDTLYDWIKKTANFAISQATIYRAMPIFMKAGIIKKSIQIKGRVNYEYALEDDHHDHLICIDCGKIIEFKNHKIEKLQEIVCKDYGFQALEHKLSIKGYCNKCQKP